MNEELSKQYRATKLDIVSESDNSDIDLEKINEIFNIMSIVNDE